VFDIFSIWSKYFWDLSIWKEKVKKKKKNQGKPKQRGLLLVVWDDAASCSVDVGVTVHLDSNSCILRPWSFSRYLHGIIHLLQSYIFFYFIYFSIFYFLGLKKKLFMTPKKNLCLSIILNQDLRNISFSYHYFLLVLVTILVFIVFSFEEKLKWNVQKKNC